MAMSVQLAYEPPIWTASQSRACDKRPEKGEEANLSDRVRNQAENNAGVQHGDAVKFIRS